MSVVVLSAVTGRTHLHWRYRTFKARLIRRCSARLGLRPGSLIRISLFACRPSFAFLLLTYTFSSGSSVNSCVVSVAPSEEASLSDVFYM